MGVICTYDTCIRDRRLLLVILWLSQLSVDFHSYQLPETVHGYQCTGFLYGYHAYQWLLQ